MKPLTTPDGEEFSLGFTAGLPTSASGPNLFLLKDGSIHSGDLLWVKNALSPTGESRVLRTTNPTGGIHERFDIPASKIVGYAFAGARYPFSSELASAY